MTPDKVRKPAPGSPHHIRSLGFSKANKHDLQVALEVETYMIEMMTTAMQSENVTKDNKRTLGMTIAVGSMRQLALQSALGMMKAVPVPLRAPEAVKPVESATEETADPA